MSGWNHKLEGLQLNPEESLHSLEFATSQEAWENAVINPSRELS